METELIHKETQVSLPIETIDSLKTQFDISDTEVKSFLAALIDKAIKERSGTDDSQVFTEAECLEMEEDLKGLGYI